VQTASNHDTGVDVVAVVIETNAGTASGLMMTVSLDNRGSLGNHAERCSLIRKRVCMSVLVRSRESLMSL
jgi:hypothetical protein